MLRMVARDGQQNDDGTERIWLPDGVTLEEAHQEGRTVTGFAGIIRNARGLGVRVRRGGIVAARLSLRKDGDRIDEETAKALVRVQFEIWGARIDTPLLAVSRALRAKGWKTLPLKSASWITQGSPATWLAGPPICSRRQKESPTSEDRSKALGGRSTFRTGSWIPISP